MNTHQQPSSKWEEEFLHRFGREVDVTGFYDERTKTDIVLSKEKKNIKKFIQSLLTSHSQAIQERVEGIIKNAGKEGSRLCLIDFSERGFGNDYISQKELLKALALLNDSDV